jgi:predicted nucleic acid-binding protein
VKFVPDTVMLIDYLNAIAAAIEWVNENHDQCVITPSTRAEILAGRDTQMLDATNRWLDTFARCDIDHSIEKSAAALRKSLRIKLLGALQAACA